MGPLIYSTFRTAIPAQLAQNTTPDNM